MGNSSSTLDKPQWEIPNCANLGAPVQVKIIGDRVAVNSVDQSLKVFKLLPSRQSELISESSDVGAWKFDISPDGSHLVTSSLNLRTVDI